MSNSILQAAVRRILIDAERDKIRISGLHIDGVEVTQAIQYRSADQHLTDLADRGPDNSIRLVADKAARVRVYVRNLPAPVFGVIGSVTVQRRRYGVWVDVACSRRSGRAASRRSRIQTTLMSVGRWRVRSTSLFPQHPCAVTCV